MKLEDLKKLEHSSQPHAASLPAGEVTAIVKVKQPRYVPAGVKVRARIDDMMFTASFAGALLASLDADPDVESVALAERLPSVD